MFVIRERFYAHPVDGQKYDWLPHSAGITDERIKQHSAAQN